MKKLSALLFSLLLILSLAVPASAVGVSINDVTLTDMVGQTGWTFSIMEEGAAAPVEKTVTVYFFPAEGGKISVPLRVPFKTALRSVNSVEDVIVEIHTDTGHVGYGEAPPTGAITGNILGAYLGASRIPEKYTQNLELLDVIAEMAEDLYHDCQINEYTIAEDPRDIAWEQKYAEVTYRGKNHD